MTARRDRLAVGQRVRTLKGLQTGEIVEDFGTLAGTEVLVDASLTTRARRWAVALDDGGLGFFDDDELESIGDGDTG
jgi:hypothetical protein